MAVNGTTWPEYRFVAVAEADPNTPYVAIFNNQNTFPGPYYSVFKGLATANCNSILHRKGFSTTGRRQPRQAATSFVTLRDGNVLPADFKLT
jgi:hypothetical protein